MQINCFNTYGNKQFSIINAGCMPSMRCCRSSINIIFCYCLNCWKLGIKHFWVVVINYLELKTPNCMLVCLSVSVSYIWQWHHHLLVHSAQAELFMPLTQPIKCTLTPSNLWLPQDRAITHRMWKMWMGWDVWPMIHIALHWTTTSLNWNTTWFIPCANSLSLVLCNSLTKMNNFIMLFLLTGKYIKYIHLCSCTLVHSLYRYNYLSVTQQ